MKTLILFLFLTSFCAMAQEKGLYRYTCVEPKVEPDTLKDTEPTPGTPELAITVQVISRKWRDETLEIKSFRRFQINGSGIVTAYGLNLDNPTIYGCYKVKGDTLILKCRKSIQHFNKLAPKRRVKYKLDLVYKYVIKEEDKLMTSEHCFWYKVEE